MAQRLPAARLGQLVRASIPSLVCCYPSPPATVELRRLLADVGAEKRSAPRDVYLVTITRSSPGAPRQGAIAGAKSLTSQQVGDAVRLALDFPMAGAHGGRPRARTDGVVDKLVAFRELHADGTPHFHVAVKLCQATRWPTAGRRGGGKCSLVGSVGRFGHYK